MALESMVVRRVRKLIAWIIAIGVLVTLASGILFVLSLAGVYAIGALVA